MPTSENPWYYLGPPRAISGYKKRSTARKRRNSSSFFHTVSSKSRASSKSGQSHFRSVSSKTKSTTPRRRPFHFTSTKKELPLLMRRTRTA